MEHWGLGHEVMCWYVLLVLRGMGVASQRFSFLRGMLKLSLVCSDGVKYKAKHISSEKLSLLVGQWALVSANS